MSFPYLPHSVGCQGCNTLRAAGWVFNDSPVCLEGELLAGMRAGLLLAAVVPSFGWVLDSPLQRRTVPEEEG